MEQIHVLPSCKVTCRCSFLSFFITVGCVQCHNFTEYRNTTLLHLSHENKYRFYTLMWCLIKMTSWIFTSSHFTKFHELTNLLFEQITQGCTFIIRLKGKHLIYHGIFDFFSQDVFFYIVWRRLAYWQYLLLNLSNFLAS